MATAHIVSYTHGLFLIVSYIEEISFEEHAKDQNGRVDSCEPESQCEPGYFSDSKLECHVRCHLIKLRLRCLFYNESLLLKLLYLFLSCF